MGNPSLLGIPSGPAPALPPAQRVLWTVYLLRRNGEPLAQDEILRTAQVGLLEFGGRPGGPVLARLVHPNGDPVLQNLYEVQLCPARSGRITNGLLLRGVVMATLKGAVQADVPQAWWCKVYRLESQGFESA